MLYSCARILVETKRMYEISAGADNSNSMDQICQKRYFQSKTEKMSINIEFYIFELMYTPNSSLN